MVGSMSAREAGIAPSRRAAARKVRTGNSR